MADRAAEVALEQVERRRRDRWAVGALLVVAVVAALALLLLDDAAARFGPLVAIAFLAVAGLFAGSVVSQERRASRIVRELLAEREQRGALEARVRALETVHRAVADVAALERLDAVFDRLLSAALELTDAEVGCTWLRVGQRLTVATSAGPTAPAVGTTMDVDEGVAGLVVRTGEPVVAGRGGEWAHGAASSVVAAPLRLPDRVVGALVLERESGHPPFDAVDRTAVALFAEQAALAVRNATRLDVERERSRSLGEEVDERATMLASIVHDLKTPLSAVIGYVQLLRAREGTIDADRRRSLYDSVLDEAGRTSRMLDGLLEAASTEAGEGRPPARVDVAGLLAGIARTAEGLAHGQGRERDVSLDAPEAVEVHADPVALQRALESLVDNAVRHSPPGSPLWLSARRDGDRALVVVRDHGPGMTEEVRGRVFDRFVSGGEGSGLGLYVVRSLVEAHHGEVSFDSSAEGTSVEVRLPLASST